MRQARSRADWAANEGSVLENVSETGVAGRAALGGKRIFSAISASAPKINWRLQAVTLSAADGFAVALSAAKGLLVPPHKRPFAALRATAKPSAASIFGGQKPRSRGVVPHASGNTRLAPIRHPPCDVILIAMLKLASRNAYTLDRRSAKAVKLPASSPVWIDG